MLSNLLKNKYVRGATLGAALLTAGCSGPNAKPGSNYLAKEKPIRILTQGTNIIYFCWNMDNDKNGMIDLVTTNPIGEFKFYPSSPQIVVAYDSSAIGNNSRTWRNCDYIVSGDAKVMTFPDASRFTQAAIAAKNASIFVDSTLSKMVNDK